MTVKTRSIDKKSDSDSLFEIKKWEKIQNLFSRIIGANISFFDPSGNDLLKASQVTPFCSVIAKPLSPHTPAGEDCVFKAFQAGRQDRTSYICSHHLNFFVLDIHPGQKVLGTLVIGPILVGKREREETYLELCKEERLDPDCFLDHFREIKLFSHTSVSVILDFLKEIVEYFLKHNSHEEELENLIPDFLSNRTGADKFFSTVYSNEIANSLLNLALHLVNGDSGSVMLFKRKEKCLYIESAKGLQSDIVKSVRIPLKTGVAGWVASRRKPILIQKEVRDTTLKSRLKRPNIRSSIVVPMLFRDEIMGVFCLNAESTNKKFNQENLQLLNQTGQLASIAFARADILK